jgi:23S rRNA (adenine2030-N6)-methyltransferase
LNYRHHFHAGNFADLLKHGLLLHLLARMTGQGEPLAVFDTHAGAGAYDLTSLEAKRSKEAEAGVMRLMGAQTPPALEPLRQAVAAFNPDGEVRLYPGSPVLVARALRSGDRYVGCELRPDDQAELAKRLRRWPNASARLADGYAALEDWAAADARLALIDPPFERADDYARAVGAVRAVTASGRPTAFAIWVPLKDLETFDVFLSGLEEIDGARGLVVQARIRPLDDPMRMNGCAMAVLGEPALLEAVEAPAREIAEWIVAALGGPGGLARVQRF